MSDNKYSKDNLTALGNEIDGMVKEVLGDAKSFGCQRAKVGTSISMKKSLCVENKEYTLANTIESQNFGIVVHRDQKKGTSTINSINKDVLSNALKAAADLASFSVADDALTMADAKQAPKAEQIGYLYDDKLPEMDLDEIQDKMTGMLEKFTNNPKVAIDRFEMSADCNRHSTLNSLGMHQSEMQTTLSWGYLGMARDGSEVSGMDYDSGFTFDLAEFGSKGSEDAEKFVERVIKNLYPIKCPSYSGKVILGPRAVATLIGGPILFHMSGGSIMDGKSKWEKSIGEVVASKLLTIRDNPKAKGFLGVTGYDGDGLPTKDHTLVENGVLKMHLLSCYTAKKLGGVSTHTSGGPFCMTFEAGKDSLQHLLDSQNEILYVDRFSGNTDPLTGNFSGVAKTSRLFRNGKDMGAVKETMIAGNMLDLCKNILAGTKETEMISGRFKSSTLLVDGVSVSGA